MHKILVISGPTASGKTSLAFYLAKKFNGELVSADSRQVYKEMDIVTGKDVDKDIKTWLLDVADPDKTFNVSNYYNLAWKTIENIWKRGKLPILVGGTGFYIKAILDGIGTMGVRPNWELRKKLEILDVEQLQKKLMRLNPKRFGSMNKSDQNNPRRLIRAIEVAKINSKFQALNSKQTQNTKHKILNTNFLWIGLAAPSHILYERIDQRVDERIKMSAVEETKKLAKEFGWNIASMTGQGYRDLSGFIEGKISLEEAVKRWKFAEHLYARKQMTWFKKEKRINWFDITEENFKLKVEERIRKSI